jgi:hypothetical protein
MNVERPLLWIHDLKQLGVLTFLIKKRLTCEHFIQDQAQRVNVGARVRYFSSRLFGRHVADGSDNCAVAR